MEADLNTHPPNVILGKQESDDTVRPDWVPGHAVWVNGQWYVNNVTVDKLGLNPNLTKLTAAERDAQYQAADKERLDKATAGLPPGYFRQGGLIYKGFPGGQNNKVASDLPGGYIDDGSHLSGHADQRAAKITGIKMASAVLHQAIAEFEAAKLRMEEAAGEFEKAHRAKEV